MKITKKGEYALRSLLALASIYESERAVAVRGIAEEEKLPIKFLEQIMMVLKQAGLVRSSKGKGGGYTLSRHPREITLGEIIRTVDGPLAPISTASEIQKKIRKNDRDAGLYVTLLEVRNAICEILDKKTLADVLEKSFELAWSEPANQMYYI